MVHGLQWLRTLTWEFTQVKAEYSAILMTQLCAGWKTLDILKTYNIGYALWNFRGGFGILDSERKDVDYVDYRGHSLIRNVRPVEEVLIYNLRKRAS